MEKIVSPVKDTSITSSNDNLVTDKSNVNITKTYTSSHNFLIGSLLLVIMVMNVIIALFTFKTLDNYKAILKENNNQLIEYKAKLTQEVDARLDSQSDLIRAFINNNRR